MSRPVVLHLDTERGWRGGQNQVYLLHRGLVRAGWNSQLVARAGEPLALRCQAEKLPVTTVARGPLFNLRAALAARACRPALLHAHASAAHGIALLAARAGTPVVVTRRVDFALKTGFFARRKYGSRVTRFVAISRAVAGVLERGGVPAERITVINSGVEPQAAVPDRRGLPESRLLVLCAAALVAHKGHRHLLEAWRDIATRVPASLLIAGSGELDAELRAQAADIPHVHFLGWRDDLAALWASVDLTVQASLEEGLGTALIDAQLAGLPVVATTAGGIPEVVADGVSGLLVPPADPDALAAALLRVLTDAALRARLAVGARSHARNFLASAMVAGYQRLYAELGIAGPHAGGDASKPEAS
jgi:glycosyltransferase involved in cell wall biosynthesis